MSPDLAGLRRELQGFFRHRTPQAADADDLAQEALVRALAKWGQLRQPEAARAWVFGIARNLLADHYRASGRQALPWEDAEQALGDGSDVERRVAFRAAIRAGLADLSAEHRQVILLRLFDDLSFGQIARRLEISESTATTRAFYGLRRLRASVATRLRREGWLVECAVVRDRLLRIGFGLEDGRREEEVQRHVAGCRECQAEMRLVQTLAEGVRSEAHAKLTVAAWTLCDGAGNAMSYWIDERANDEGAPRTEWGVNSGRSPDDWSWFDQEGRRLPEARRWRHDDGRWGMRFRLHEPWQPGSVLRVIGAMPIRVPVHREDDFWVLLWQDRPMHRDSPVPEVLCRRVIQLPLGCHAVLCDPEPDHCLDAGRLLAWSMVVPRGDHFRLTVRFQGDVPAAPRPASPARPLHFATSADHQWRWSSPDDPEVVRLREDLHPEPRVAGARDDYERLRALCHLAHVRDREPATLHACLAAVGIRSRVVSLYPPDGSTAAYTAIEAFLGGQGWAFADPRHDALPRLGGRRPLSAVRFQQALAEGDPDLEIDSPSGTTLAEYAPQVLPYLHYLSAPLDNRVDADPAQRPQLVLVPEGAPEPRLPGEITYVRTLSEFYPIPQA